MYSTDKRPQNAAVIFIQSSIVVVVAILRFESMCPFADDHKVVFCHEAAVALDLFRNGVSAVKVLMNGTHQATKSQVRRATIT